MRDQHEDAQIDKERLNGVQRMISLHLGWDAGSLEIKVVNCVPQVGKNATSNWLVFTISVRFIHQFWSLSSFSSCKFKFFFSSFFTANPSLLLLLLLISKMKIDRCSMRFNWSWGLWWMCWLDVHRGEWRAFRFGSFLFWLMVLLHELRSDDPYPWADDTGMLP